MNTIQHQTIKIKKRTTKPDKNKPIYICGGCQQAHKSYPALYLHIKHTHNGVRPPNTKTSKPIFPVSGEKIYTYQPMVSFFSEVMLSFR